MILTMLNSIPTNAMMPNIHTQVINIGTKVISVNSIRPYRRNKAKKTSTAVNVTIKLKSALTYSTNRLVSICRSNACTGEFFNRSYKFCLLTGFTFTNEITVTYHFFQ